ncbi:MAG TPA: hypothetical protein VMF30_09680 [Pirellulales bacterium]|nr:hypothetical protein [Pirellulales bacterium]
MRLTILCLALVVVAICFSPLQAAEPAGRSAEVMARGDARWMSAQINEPCILPNPKMPDRLIMFYSANNKYEHAVGTIGKAWANVDNPFRWHQDFSNPIFTPGKGGWDSGTLRIDCVLYIPEEDAYYIYYSATQGECQDHIGLAICPAGDDGYTGVTPQNIVRYGTAPILAPEPDAPFFETYVHQSAVIREQDPTTKKWKWYLYYSYRGKDGILPGIRLATSDDGKTWTRRLNPNDPRGMGQIFASTPEAYYEWHQVLKVGDTYLLSIEVGVEHGKRWRPVLAVSKDPVTGWQQLDVDTGLQTKWSAYDERSHFHVATPAFYQIAGKWYLYVQACSAPTSGNYTDGGWDFWCFECPRKIPTLPGHADFFLPDTPAASQAIK